MRRHRSRSLFWRMSRAIEQATVSRPLFSRTGPAWLFGLMGVAAELVLAPVVLALTFTVGIASYLVLDAPWTRIRAEMRPRFVSVRILYLNTLIVAGFWLAVMFTFSAADPSLSNPVEQRLPALLAAATSSNLQTLIDRKHQAQIKPVDDPVGSAASWFDVFLHGLICGLALNFLLYGVVIARRRQRARHGRRSSSRKSLSYDSR